VVKTEQDAPGSALVRAHLSAPGFRGGLGSRLGIRSRGQLADRLANPAGEAAKQPETAVKQ